MNFKNSLHCPPNFFLIVRVIFCVMCVNYVFNRLNFEGVDPKSINGLPCKASLCFTFLR